MFGLGCLFVDVVCYLFEEIVILFEFLDYFLFVGVEVVIKILQFNWWHLKMFLFVFALKTITWREFFPDFLFILLIAFCECELNVTDATQRIVTVIIIKLGVDT